MRNHDDPPWLTSLGRALVLTGVLTITLVAAAGGLAGIWWLLTALN